MSRTLIAVAPIETGIRITLAVHYISPPWIGDPVFGEIGDRVFGERILLVFENYASNSRNVANVQKRNSEK